jgi:hypothetical protein
MLAHVPSGQCTKDGVNNGMGQHIGIRMAQQTQVMGNFNASKDQGTALPKTVGIISKTDAEHLFTRSVERFQPSRGRFFNDTYCSSCLRSLYMRPSRPMMNSSRCS